MKIVATILLLTTPLLAAAQSAPGPDGAKLKAAPYQSSFKLYRGFVDQPVGSWREINDTVSKIGGWRFYARDAEAALSTTKPAQESSAPDSHMQHGGAMK